MRNSQAPTAAAQLESTRLRLTFLTLLVVSLFVLLFARLWFLQVMAGERYAGLAEGNAVRSVTVPAPRGKLLDRNGKPLVQNRYAMVVSVQPDEMGERADEVLRDVADLLGVPLREIRDKIDGARVSALQPKPIAVDVPQDIILYLHENRSTRFPGVYAESLPVRDYPHGDTASHLLGYLGEVSEVELADPAYDGYQPGDAIGWSGLERSYEQVLHGAPGLRRYEVNARGDILEELADVLPTPGADVTTTIDLKAQRLVESSLARGIRRARDVRDESTGPGRGGTFKAPAGAAVVLDPHNGEVVAMASYPTFEPERFVGGVGARYWKRLQDPSNDFPLINRAVQSSYPPGSVYKVISAAAALENGYLTPERELPCPGEWYWGPQRFRNWTSVDMRPMAIDEALEQSCDTVFYEVARRMWTDELNDGDGAVEQLVEQSKAWGLGAATGIDLPSERTGLVPGREWKRQFWLDNRSSYCSQAKRAPKGSYAHRLFSDLCANGGRWRGGDAVNMSIGQGDLQTTPLQIANAYAAIANGGTLFRPHIGGAVTSADGRVDPVEPEVLAELPVSRRHLRKIAKGLEMVTSQGTAEATFGDFPVPVAGKTGTAEFKPKQPFAWFAAYAPADDPQYVVVTVVEEGGGGSLNAAPITRRILEGLLGLEMNDIQPGVSTD